jgi:ABC-type multidrug transport system fused ATPase/permease subunit
MVQQTIRESFANCTVLTIAHRLDTIIDSDRIMVLDKGSLMELDTPANLLRNPVSLFSKLVKETGRIESVKLRSLAAKKLGIVLSSHDKD